MSVTNVMILTMRRLVFFNFLEFAGIHKTALLRMNWLRKKDWKLRASLGMSYGELAEQIMTKVLGRKHG